MDVKTLYIIFACFHLFFAASFTLSLYAAMHFEVPPHMKNFYVYPGVALIMIIFFWLDYFRFTPTGFFSGLNFLSLIFHFIFLTWFIFRVIKYMGNYKFENLIRILFVILVLASIVNDYVKDLHRSYIVVNALLFFYCLFYFARLFKNQSQIRLTFQPEFWIITGVFLGMGIIFPFYVFHDFLHNRVTKETINLLRLIGGVGYATMHLFFVKGFLQNARLQMIK